MRLARWSRSPLLGLLVTSSCAIGPGRSFAELEAHLAARFEVPSDRATTPGWARLSTDYEVALRRFVIELDELALVSAPAGGATFDPANPPEGYSLCHGGHCHADDGSLVSYEDIAAESLQGAGATVLVALPVGALDLVSGEERPLSCEPSCRLSSSGELRQVKGRITSLELLAAVRDASALGRLDGEGVLQWGPAALEEVFVKGPLELPLDNAHAPNVRLRLELEFGPALLDGLDFGALFGALPPDARRLALDDERYGDVRARLAERLAAVPVRIELERNP